MIRAILAKEVSQHKIALILLFLLLIISTAILLLWVVAGQDSGSPLMGFRAFLMYFLPIAVFILTDRLVRSEYTGKTQFFLESLPVSRLTVVSTKFVFGLSVVFLISASIFVAVFFLTLDSELYTFNFILALILRTAVWTFFLYAVFFMFAFLGRYRMALILFVLFGFISAERFTAIELSELSPFVVIGQRFAFERDVLPTQDLLITAGVSILFILIGLVMAIASEGSVAALMAEKMSHREKIFIAAALIALLSIIGFAEEKIKKKPFDLKDAITETQGGVFVEVSNFWNGSERPKQLAKKVVSELSAVSDFLGVEDVPPVFITYRGDLDGNRFERATLAENEGILVRVNYDDAAWNETRFLSWLIREVLLERSHDRVGLEQKRWILDGFSLFWFTRKEASKSLVSYEKLALRALYGNDKQITIDQLNSWLTYQERSGNDISSAIAWSGLHTLAKTKGISKTRKFLQLTLGIDVPQDVRALFYERGNSWPDILKRTTGIEASDFLKTWNEELTLTRNQLSVQLQNLPKINSDFQLVKLSPKTHTVRYKVHILPEPAASFQYTVLYRQLSPLNEEIDLRTLRREEALYEVSRNGELPLTFSSGSRFLGTTLVYVDALDCEVISGWIRKEIN